MIPLPFFNNKSSIGLDIHVEEVRLLQLKRQKKCICIEQLMVLELPNGAIMDGQIVDAVLVKETIEQMIEMTKVQGWPVAIALPVMSVMKKHIHLPGEMTEEECESYISSHLTQIYCQSEPLCFDFITLSHEAKQREILCIAVRQQQLSDYVNVVNWAGLNVNIVDVDSYAMTRAAAFSLEGINPLLSMKLSPAVEVKTLSIVAPRMLVSCGLALRGIQS